MENNAKIQYVADGQNTVFETPFSIFITNGVDIYLEDQKQDPQSYQVTLDAEKRATITFNQPPQNNTLITIKRAIPVKRISQFQEGGALRASTLNYEFDYQMACLQDVSEVASRSMAYPPYAVGTDVDLTLPSPEAGKSIMWSADGTKLENSNVLVNELEGALKEYKEEAEASAIVAQTASNMAVEKSIEVATIADEAISAIDGKANSDMSNITQAGIKKIISNAMPDYSAGTNITLPYTAPSNGYIYASWYTDRNGVAYSIDDNVIVEANTGAYGVTSSAFIPISEGEVFSISDYPTTHSSAVFYPLKGAI